MGTENKKGLAIVSFQGLPEAAKGEEGGRGKPTSVNPLGPGAPDGPPIGFILASLTSKLVSFTSSF